MPTSPVSEDTRSRSEFRTNVDAFVEQVRSGAIASGGKRHGTWPVGAEDGIA